MNYQTQSTLTILASSLLFSLAGFWLMPNQAKGAIVGAAAGTAVAAGYVRQDRHLKQLFSEQQDINSTQRMRVNNLTALIAKAKRTVEKIALTTQAHETKINTFAETLGPKSGQAKLNLYEINSIKVKLQELESKIDRISTNTENDESDVISRIELTLRELESKVIPFFLSQASHPDQEVIVDEEEILVDGALIAVSRGENLEGKAAQKVIEWFGRKHIEVESYYEPDPKIDALLDGLSLYLGDNYSTLNKLHWRLRKSVGRRTHFDLKNYDSREKRIHNQYLKKLKTSDFLSLGRLIKNKEGSDFILAASYGRSDIQGFFDGGWFERFIYYKVVELFDSEGVDYQYLRNPKIVYKNEELSELDLFFLINGEPLLIECKAGQNYHQGIEKFDLHRKKLNLDPNNAIFVVLDIDESEAHIRNKNWNITVADQNNFLDRIKGITAIHRNVQLLADADDDDGEEEPRQSILVIAKDDSLETFLKKQKLNLVPESRSIVFTELIKLFNPLDKPISFNEITKTLRDRMQEESGLARGKVVEILNCLRHFGFFRDIQKKPVLNTSELIYSLASLKSKTFERKCMEFYAEKILQLFDPDFFEEAENIKIFENLTLGTAPPPDKVKQMKERWRNL